MHTSSLLFRSLSLNFWCTAVLLLMYTMTGSRQSTWLKQRISNSNNATWWMHSRFGLLVSVTGVATKNAVHTIGKIEIHGKILQTNRSCSLTVDHCKLIANHSTLCYTSVGALFRVNCSLNQSEKLETAFFAGKDCLKKDSWQFVWGSHAPRNLFFPLWRHQPLATRNLYAVQLARKKRQIPVNRENRQIMTYTRTVVSDGRFCSLSGFSLQCPREDGVGGQTKPLNAQPSMPVLTTELLWNILLGFWTANAYLFFVLFYYLATGLSHSLL